MLQDFSDQFLAASFMFAKFNLRKRFFYSMQAQIRSCTLQLSVFDVSEQMPFGSNDVEEESAVIQFSLPRQKIVLNAVNTSRRPLQCKGADMDTFFCLKNNHRRDFKTALNKLLLRSIFRD